MIYSHSFFAGLVTFILIVVNSYSSAQDLGGVPNPCQEHSLAGVGGPCGISPDVQVKQGCTIAFGSYEDTCNPLRPAAPGSLTTYPPSGEIQAGGVSSTNQTSNTPQVSSVSPNTTPSPSANAGSSVSSSAATPTTTPVQPQAISPSVNPVSPLVPFIISRPSNWLVRQAGEATLFISPDNNVVLGTYDIALPQAEMNFPQISTEVYQSVAILLQDLRLSQINVGGRSDATIQSRPALMTSFLGYGPSGVVNVGVIAFIADGDKVHMLIAYGPSSTYENYRMAVHEMMVSYRATH